ncbi:hypothetical protein J6590_105302, partial [Homalodisca vitripennis]
KMYRRHVRYIRNWEPLIYHTAKTQVPQFRVAYHRDEFICHRCLPLSRSAVETQ